MLTLCPASYDKLVLVAQSCQTLCNPMEPTSPPWDSPGMNTGVCCHSLLQGLFLTQGRSPELQADSLPSEPPGKSMTSLTFINSNP